LEEGDITRCFFDQKAKFLRHNSSKNKQDMTLYDMKCTLWARS